MADTILPPPPPIPYNGFYWGPNLRGDTAQQLFIEQVAGQQIPNGLVIFSGVSYQRGFDPGLLYARVGGNSATGNVLGRISFDNGITGGIGPRLIAPGAGVIETARTRFYVGLFITMRLSGVVGVWGNETGILFRAERTGVNFWAPDAGATVDRAGLGLIGDQAGGWMFASKVNDNAVGAFDETVPVPWPVALTDWATVGFQFFSATAVDPARVTLSVAGSPLVERTWPATGISPTLPTYNAVDASGNFGWCVSCQAAGVVSPGLRIDVQDITLIKGPMVHDIDTGGIQ